MTHGPIPLVYYSNSASASPVWIPKKYPLQKCFLLYSILKFYAKPYPIPSTRHLRIRITKRGGTRGNLAIPKNRHQTTPRASNIQLHMQMAPLGKRAIPRIPPSPFSASREEVQPLSAPSLIVFTARNLPRQHRHRFPSRRKGEEFSANRERERESMLARKPWLSYANRRDQHASRESFPRLEQPDFSPRRWKMISPTIDTLRGSIPPRLVRRASTLANFTRESLTREIIERNSNKVFETNRKYSCTCILFERKSCHNTKKCW